MIAVDTNLLVYAHRRDSDFSERAYACIRQLAEGAGNWAILWPCLHEFYAIVTHPRIYDPPSTRHEALDQIDAWLESPGVILLAEPENYKSHLRAALEGGQIVGARVHDARIAALCAAHGIRELWTADRDFGRFQSLRARNPM